MKPHMTAELGRSFGAKLSAAESTIALRGDPLLALGYAALFFPRISLENGVPLAMFATSTSETPIDCVHINLLHHNEALGCTSEAYAALGTVLAGAWNNALKNAFLVGHFRYEEKDGFAVVYEP